MGSRVTSVFTFGAGVQWFEAYEAAKQRNRVIVGGVCSGGSVGVSGGWLAGGGHSLISPNYGLGMLNKICLIRLSRTHTMVCRRRQRLADNDRHRGWRPRHCQPLPQQGSVLGPSRWRWRYLGRCHFGHLQIPPLHFLLCRLPFSQPHQRRLNPEIAYGDHPSHSLARRAGLWRLHLQNYRTNLALRRVTQRHGRTDPGHLLPSV